MKAVFLCDFYLNPVQIHCLLASRNCYLPLSTGDYCSCRICPFPYLTVFLWKQSVLSRASQKWISISQNHSLPSPTVRSYAYSIFLSASCSKPFPLITSIHPMITGNLVKKSMLVMEICSKVRAQRKEVFVILMITIKVFLMLSQVIWKASSM